MLTTDYEKEGPTKVEVSSQRLRHETILEKKYLVRHLNYKHAFKGMKQMPAEAYT